MSIFQISQKYIAAFAEKRWPKTKACTFQEQNTQSS